MNTHYSYTIDYDPTDLDAEVARAGAAGELDDCYYCGEPMVYHLLECNESITARCNLASAATMRAVLEAWAWLSGNHPMLEHGTYSALDRVSKAETCLAGACFWEYKYPEGAKLWASTELNGGKPAP